MQRKLNYKIEATYQGIRSENHILTEVSGDVKRDHLWINGSRGNFPDDVPIGSRVKFFASLLDTRNGPRITDVRELAIITPSKPNT